MYRDLHVDVKDPVGSTHEDEEISIGGLMGVPASIDQKAFKGAVRNYYQSLEAISKTDGEMNSC